jgi:hypothetical protein
MSDLRGLIQGEWDHLAEVVLRLDGHLRGLGLEHEREKILYISDVIYGVYSLSHVLKLDPLSYNKISGF